MKIQQNEIQVTRPAKQLREGPQHQLLQWAQLVPMHRHLEWLPLTTTHTTQRPTTRVRLDLLRPPLVAAQPTMEQTTDTQTMDLQQRQVRPQQLTGSEADEITSPLIKLNRTYFPNYSMCILQQYKLPLV